MNKTALAFTAGFIAGVAALGALFTSAELRRKAEENQWGRLGAPSWGEAEHR